MAKKKQRRRSRSGRKKTATVATNTPEVTAEEMVAVEAEIAEIAAVKPRFKRTRQQVAAAQLEEQYAYVVGDLRRVLILAAVMFGLLILANVALGFLTN